MHHSQKDCEVKYASIEDYMTYGTEKQCGKCGIVSMHHTVCLSCLNALRDEHAKHRVIWDMDPMAATRSNVSKEKIVELYNKGLKASQIAIKLNMPTNSVSGTILNLINNGIVQRRTVK